MSGIVFCEEQGECVCGENCLFPRYYPARETDVVERTQRVKDALVDFDSEGFVVGVEEL